MGDPCPQCGKRMMLDFSTSQIKCFGCGYVRPDDIGRLAETEREVKQRGAPLAVNLAYNGEISPYAMSAFESGQYALHDGDKAKAFEYFTEAAEVQPDFVDAHLWAAKSTDDPKKRRSLLGDVLVALPNHLEALRMLMVLDGKLTAEEAARTHHFDDPRVQYAPDPVETKTQALLCPTCGGDLEQSGDQVNCRFCGYHALTADYRRQVQKESDNSRELTMALLKRKAQRVRWDVGKRVVQCNQCGAVHTITAGQMSERCRFCGSTAVILSDALDSFDQPERILPFSVTRETALAAIQKQLSTFGERFLGFFDSNKVDHGIMHGVYLPHWVFDTTVDVTRVKTRGGLEVERDTFLELVDDVAVCAVKSPPRSLTAGLGGWSLESAVEYDPKWLATHPAQIAKIDFADASLDARAYANQYIKQRHNTAAEDFLQNSMSRDNKEKIVTTFFTSVQGMSFTLMLLPVWVALLFEVDGDERQAVVNGQTGKVALGKAQKPEHKK